MRTKYYDAYFRWRPHLTTRQLRSLRSTLRHTVLEIERVGVDGLEGQIRWPEDEDDVTNVLAAVEHVVKKGLIGAIVPRGYGDDGHDDTMCDCAILTQRNDVNTMACVTVRAYTSMPPLAVIDTED